MAFDLEEQEKIDALRSWWNRFGNIILTTAIVVMLGFLANYGYAWYQTNQAQKALNYYEIIDGASSGVQVQSDTQQRVEQAVAALQNDYSSTVYASRGTLLAADYLVKSKQEDKAAQLLQWLISKADDYPLVAPIAKLNLASLLANQQKYDESLALLNNPVSGYEALYLDRKGDILQAQGKKDEAVKLWQESLKKEGLSAQFIQAVQLKINALGGV